MFVWQSDEVKESARATSINHSNDGTTFLLIAINMYLQRSRGSTATSTKHVVLLNMCVTYAVVHVFFD